MGPVTSTALKTVLIELFLQWLICSVGFWWSHPATSVRVSSLNLTKHDTVTGYKPADTTGHKLLKWLSETQPSPRLAPTAVSSVSTECTSFLLQVPWLKIQGWVNINPAQLISCHYHLTSLHSHPLSALVPFSPYANVWFINAQVMRSHFSVASLHTFLLGLLDTRFYSHSASTPPSPARTCLALFSATCPPAWAAPQLPELQTQPLSLFKPPVYLLTLWLFVSCTSLHICFFLI